MGVPTSNFERWLPMPLRLKRSSLACTRGVKHVEVEICLRSFLRGLDLEAFERTVTRHAH